MKMWLEHLDKQAEPFFEVYFKRKFWNLNRNDEQSWDTRIRVPAIGMYWLFLEDSIINFIIFKAANTF